MAPHWLKSEPLDGTYAVFSHDAEDQPFELIRFDRHHLGQGTIGLKRAVSRLLSKGTSGEVQITDPAGKTLVHVQIHFAVADAQDSLDARRRTVLENWYGRSGMNGLQIEAADGWEHASDADDYTRHIFVDATSADMEEEAGEDSDTVSMQLAVRFKPGNAIIDYAAIDGTVVDGSRNWGQVR